MRPARLRLPALAAATALLLPLTGCGAGGDPPGPAATAAGTGRTATRHLTVVGLGDSVPSGEACHCTDYVHLYAAGVQQATGSPTQALDEAVPGLDSAGLLRQLNGATAASNAVARADLITVTIGANDFVDAQEQSAAGTCGGKDGLDCFRARLPALRTNLDAVLRRIHELVDSRAVAVRVTNYWNVFDDGQVAARSRSTDYLRDSDHLTLLVDNVICAAATAAHVPCVDLYAPFKGADGAEDPTKLLAGDGDHPNAAGHAAIARALEAVGYAPVT